MTSQKSRRGDNGESHNFESLHQYPPATVDGSFESTKRTEGLTPITQTRAAPATTGLENFPGATSNTDSGEAHPTSKFGNDGWTQETHEPRHRSCPTLYPPISPPPEHQYPVWTRPTRMIIDIVIQVLYYTTIIFTLGQAPRIEVLKKEILLIEALRDLIADCQRRDPRTSKEHNTLIRRIVAFDTRNTPHEGSAYGSMKKRWKEIVPRIRSTWADYATFNLTLALIASWTRFGSRFDSLPCLTTVSIGLIGAVLTIMLRHSFYYMRDAPQGIAWLLESEDRQMRQINEILLGMPLLWSVWTGLSLLIRLLLPLWWRVRLSIGAILIIREVVLVAMSLGALGAALVLWNHVHQAHLVTRTLVPLVQRSITDFQIPSQDTSGSSVHNFGSGAS